MSAFKRIDAVGGQAIDEVSTTQYHPFGFRIRGHDPTLGDAEFVYVKGVASGAIGLASIVNLLTGVIALTGARSKGIIGVLMSVLDATTKFGWVQVRGTGEVQVAGAVVAGTTVYLTGTAGKVDDAVVTGDIVYGANFATADGTPVANWARVSLCDPYTGDTDNA